jgi:hypothetical protein
MSEDGKTRAPAAKAGPVQVPVTETRGGQDPDWDNARPGEPLPQKPEGNNDPDAP